MSAPGPTGRPPTPLLGEPARRPPRRWLRRTLIGIAVLLVLVLAGAAFIGWQFSNRILEPDRSGGDYDLEVQKATNRLVTLPLEESTERPGTYGLEWEEGSAILGRVRETGEDSVTRRLRRVDGDLAAGTDARLISAVFQGDPRTARGLPFEEVEVKGELGAMPAWRIDAPNGPVSETWAIMVHGINGDRREGLRIAPALLDSGLTPLSISYRDDEIAPPSRDGLHHMGQTEWRDAEAAARYALDHGAERLVMVGFSMGGAIVTQFMERSKLADRAEAMILDSPALDWERTIAFAAGELGLPGAAGHPVEWAIEMRIDVDWDRLDALDHTGELRVPTLLFHGAEDRIVPIATSDDFAEALPRTVTYHRSSRAGHVQAWNVDPSRYERRVRRFLASEGLGG